MDLPFQPGILDPVPAAGRYLSFRIRLPAALREGLDELRGRTFGSEAVVGVGPAVVRSLGCEVEGLRELPALAGPGVCSPSTPGALWVWLRGDEPGELFLRGRELAACLAPAFELVEEVGAFRHGPGRDLSGYEDGTENPTGPAAVEAAFVSGSGPGRDGSSFVAVQRWVHDFGRLAALREEELDRIVGRRRSDNEELSDAPATAHVVRTAQEDFDPPAFLLRRSMPWVESEAGGLVFVAFGHSLDSFVAQLRRMCGLDDGITDALFGFTRPVTGSAYWCPPLAGSGRLDFTALGL